jgi:hypothetical protein
MTVEELIKKLKEFDKNTLVSVSIEGDDRNYLSILRDVKESDEYQAIELRGKLK